MMMMIRIVGFYVEPLSIEHAYSGEWDGNSLLLMGTTLSIVSIYAN